MKTQTNKKPDLRAMMAAVREDHAFKVETAIMEFTEELVELLEEHGISKTELARRIAVKPPYITKILQGTSNFTLDSMVKIATALDCEFRCHLQRKGRDTQWFEFLNEKPESESSRYDPSNYRVIPMPNVKVTQFESELCAS